MVTSIVSFRIGRVFEDPLPAAIVTVTPNMYLILSLTHHAARQPDVFAPVYHVCPLRSAPQHIAGEGGAGPGRGQPVLWQQEKYTPG